jgi:hypothetical protein
MFFVLRPISDFSFKKDYGNFYSSFANPFYNSKPQEALLKEIWLKNKVAHRILKPAFINTLNRNFYFYEGRIGFINCYENSVVFKVFESLRGTHYISFNLDGTKTRFFSNGNNHKYFHSFEEPSIIYPNGTKEWYVEDKLHRSKDLPAVVYPNGDKEWWHFGKRHNKNSPAVIYGNKKYWFCNGDFLKFE